MRNEIVEPCESMGGRFKFHEHVLVEKVTLNLLFGSVWMHCHKLGPITPFVSSCKGFVRLTPRLPDGNRREYEASFVATLCLAKNCCSLLDAMAGARE